MKREALIAIEEKRQSRVMVLAASHLDLELLPSLFDVLSTVAPAPRLDVIIQCKGGLPHAARRIALLLREHCEHLTFIVPFKCESAGTIMATAADEIIAGPAAIFSPIDPQLQSEPGQSQNSAVSSEDVRLFGQMCREWFDVPSEHAHERAFSVLSSNIFPTTLTSFYRSVQEVRSICLELLSTNKSIDASPRTSAIADKLLHGFFSHGFPLTGKDLAKIGLPARRDKNVEKLAWEISAYLRDTIGGGVRADLDDDWSDALLATSEHLLLRKRRSGHFEPKWVEETLKA